MDIGTNAAQDVCKTGFTHSGWEWTQNDITIFMMKWWCFHYGACPRVHFWHQSYLSAPRWISITNTFNSHFYDCCTVPQNWKQPSNMMTSSNGNIFRVTGHLCGEFTGNREAGDLRRYRAHYDVTVMNFLQVTDSTFTFLGPILLTAINTLRPGQNGCHFADDSFKCICLNKNVRISIQTSLKFVPEGPINNIPALVQTMAWHRQDDKPLSEPMMVKLLTHIYVTRSQWINQV